MPIQTSSDHDTQPVLALRPFLHSHSVISQPRLWPLVAFWVGTALFFAISSVLSAIRFIEVLLDISANWPVPGAHHFAWLGATVFLFACSMISLALALLVFGKHISGLYGSLVFSLLLTLIIPLVGLLVPQPNYPGVVCAGLIPAASVLYTILNLDSFLSN